MKKIFLVIFTLIVILGGASYWFLDNLDEFIKSYMIEYGSKMTKTDFEVDSVQTDFQKGEIIINRIGIENPKGFSNSEAFEVKKVKINIKKDSLNQDVIEVPLVLINNPEIIYEYNGKKTNFNVLKNNIQGYQNNSDQPASEKKVDQAEKKQIKENKKPKKFFIKELKIIDLEIKARVSSLKKDFLNKTIPLIVIKDIGSKSNGATPEFILEKIVLNVDDNLETIFDFKSLKTDIRKNIDKIINTLKDDQKSNSENENIDHKKIINNIKDLF
tara:strand:+ start:349 stop:1164 length:816 start_codon:yes stop_codon:yes gene_type:complete